MDIGTGTHPRDIPPSGGRKGRDMQMKDAYKKAGKRLAGILTAACCVGLAVGHISLDDLTSWGRTAAMLSVGLMQPAGGAEALSERLDRTPDKGAAATTAPTSANTTAATTAGSGTSQPTTSTTTPPTTGTIPPKKEGGGVVKELKMGLGSDFVQGVAIKNSSGKTFDIAKEIQIKPNFKIKNSAEPQVLIVHTHTTEAYMSYYAGYYNEGDGGRSKDESKNVCAVGEAIAAELRAAGIGVIHDTTIHDNPKYTGAYTRSEETVNKNLQQYPSIQVVLDVHRDGIMIDNTTKAKPTVTINGKKAAQTMIIVGTVSTSALPHPNWQDNFHFALQLQKAAVAKYEGLMRPVSVVASRYNQHLARGYLLVEMGSEGNTLDEAVYSGQMLGKTLGEVLQTLK